MTITNENSEDNEMSCENNEIRYEEIAGIKETRPADEFPEPTMNRDWNRKFKKLLVPKQNNLKAQLCEKYGSVADMRKELVQLQIEVAKKELELKEK
jgi:hypothetical protein